MKLLYIIFFLTAIILGSSQLNAQTIEEIKIDGKMTPKGVLITNDDGYVVATQNNLVYEFYKLKESKIEWKVTYPHSGEFNFDPIPIMTDNSGGIVDIIISEKVNSKYIYSVLKIYEGSIVSKTPLINGSYSNITSVADYYGYDIFFACDSLDYTILKKAYLNSNKYKLETIAKHKGSTRQIKKSTYDPKIFYWIYQDRALKDGNIIAYSERENKILWSSIINGDDMVELHSIEETNQHIFITGANLSNDNWTSKIWSYDKGGAFIKDSTLNTPECYDIKFVNNHLITLELYDRLNAQNLKSRITITGPIYNKTFFQKGVLPTYLVVKNKKVIFAQLVENQTTLFVIDLEAPTYLTKYVSDLKKLIVYPNPATEFINVESDANNEISILDFKGNLIRRSFENRINIYDLNSGIYVIKSKSKSSKFIKR